MTTATAHTALERYKLGEPLGQGGQGRTYAATDTRTGRPVAVKVIQLGGGGGWKPFDLFERECEVLRSLSHPGIPRYVDTFADEDAGKYYLVMELCRGQTLRRLLDERVLLSEAQLWNILHQTLEILDYLHGRRPPVIHRDIKPANLIRRTEGSLALVDFGGVRVALREEGGSTVVGTFGYMAPEQLHGEATAATDIYGLGATLAALASGREADKLPRKGLRVDLTQVLPASALRELLARMLAPEPSERLASVAAVREAIAAATSSGSAAAAGRRREAPAPPRPRGPEREPEPGSELEPEDPGSSPLRGVPFPVSTLVRFLGGMGYVGLLLLDAIMLPLIFVMLGAVWSSRPERVRQLGAKKDTVRRVLGSGRRAMKALALGRDPYHPTDRQLPGGDRQAQLPPPGRGRGRGGGGRGRRRGQR